MKVTKSELMLSTLKKNHENGTLSFKPPMQRRDGQWSNYSKSLLIHSILSDIPVPAVYAWEVIEDNTPVQYVIDGIQRLSIVFDFLNDDFSIHNSVESVVDSNGTEYKISGCKFSTLPDELKNDISRYKPEIKIISDCTYEEAAEVFYRLNNSVPLSSNQRFKARYSQKFISFTDELLDKEFFTNICHFSKAQYRKGDDLLVLTQAMMLYANRYTDYELKSFSSLDGNKFILSSKPEDDEQYQVFAKAVDFLADALSDTDNSFVKKINIPMILYLGTVCVKEDVSAEDFREWFTAFLNDETQMNAYKQYCGQGSTSSVKVLGRCAVLEDSLATATGNNKVINNVLRQN